MASALKWMMPVLLQIMASWTRMAFFSNTEGPATSRLSSALSCHASWRRPHANGLLEPHVILCRSHDRLALFCYSRNATGRDEKIISHSIIDRTLRMQLKMQIAARHSTRSHLS